MPLPVVEKPNGEENVLSDRLARLEMRRVWEGPLTSRQGTPTPSSTSSCCRTGWPAWKCVGRGRVLSHPGTPTQLREAADAIQAIRESHASRPGQPWFVQVR